MNRLKLDWALTTSKERSDFIQTYLPTLKFSPTPEELECAANYVLFGKDEDGTSISDRGEVQIETKNKTWTKDDTESLDALMESPTFNEATLRRPTEAKIRIKREKFSREAALRDCPPFLRETFENLFREIDELDLAINFYELAHGKRQNPPREELLRRFSPEEQEKLQLRAKQWNQYTYLKRRHLLVELRREQFTLRDSYVTVHMREVPPEPQEPDITPDFGAEIPVFPLGIFDSGATAALLFKPKEFLNPASYTEENLRKISTRLWQKNTERRSLRPTSTYFDFQELEHVYNLFQQLFELDESIDETKNLGTQNLLRTLYFYLDFAELNEIQKQILEKKIQKMKNQDIADLVNKEFGKSYTANYISTIFRQKIIPQINDAAALHLRIMENIFFEEEFKKCSVCGLWKLRDSENFVKKTRSKDGFAGRCKKCDKLDRQMKKGGS